ncbi:MAG: SCO1664 family protein [Acidimicrobiales bacterium]
MPEDERPHAAAHLSGPSALAVLSAGEVEVSGRLPWSSNYSFLVAVRLDGAELRAVYKPGRGERPLWDFGDHLYRREVAAYELSAYCGLGLVPETVLRLDAPLGEGSLQRFVGADFSKHYFSLLEEPAHLERLEELAGLDLLMNNADRKAGHVLVDAAGGIWGIDNGLCFHAEAKLRTVMWDFACEPLPESVLSACRRLVLALPSSLGRLLNPAECSALQARARRLLERPRFPEPRDDHRSYPWPLV